MERRRARARRLRRRRLAALAALMAAAGAVGVAVVVALSGGDSGEGGGATATERGEGAGGEGRAPRRPATPTAQAEQARAAASPADAKVTRRTPVPILMYHGIGDPPPGAGLPELYVAPDDFAAELRALAERGYEAVTLDRVYSHWHGGPPLPRKPIAITFDDGFPGWHRYALPAMRRHRWPGVLNVQVDLIGGPVTARGLRELVAAGWEIDAHTFSHTDMTTLDPRRLRREVAGSRRALQRRFDVPVNFFCYPAGAYDETVIEAVRAAGYRGATTTEPALATPSDPFTLPRIRINRSDGVEGTLAKLP